MESDRWEAADGGGRFIVYNKFNKAFKLCITVIIIVMSAAIRVYFP